MTDPAATIREAQSRMAKHVADLEWPKTQNSPGWYVALDYDWKALSAALDALVGRIEELEAERPERDVRYFKAGAEAGYALGRQAAEAERDALRQKQAKKESIRWQRNYRLLLESMLSIQGQITGLFAEATKPVKEIDEALGGEGVVTDHAETIRAILEDAEQGYQTTAADYEVARNALDGLVARVEAAEAECDATEEALRMAMAELDAVKKQLARYVEAHDGPNGAAAEMIRLRRALAAANERLEALREAAAQLEAWRDQHDATWKRLSAATRSNYMREYRAACAALVVSQEQETPSQSLTDSDEHSIKVKEES